MSIPARKDASEVGDKERRFYLFAPASIVLAIQGEAVARGVDAWRLAGAVLEQWIKAGCPDDIRPRE